MGLSDDLERLFGERDPYAVLEVSKDASSSRIKQAYFRLAKLWHPDKVADGVDSAVHTEKFQALSKLYSIFSDGEKRKVSSKLTLNSPTQSFLMRQNRFKMTSFHMRTGEW
jgi:molecular chaperone DnaJ